jgi:hypothetical protein
MVWIITVNYWITFIWAIHGLELGCGNNIFWIHLGKWILWWTKKCTKKSIFTFFWCCHYFLNEFFDYKLSFCKNYVLQPFFMTWFTTLILSRGQGFDAIFSNTKFFILLQFRVQINDGASMCNIELMSKLCTRKKRCTMEPQKLTHRSCLLWEKWLSQPPHHDGAT